MHVASLLKWGEGADMLPPKKREEGINSIIIRFSVFKFIKKKKSAARTIERMG